MKDDLKQSSEGAGDKAGVEHWDETYLGWQPGVFKPHLKGIRYRGRKAWHQLFTRLFHDYAPSKGRLIEVGCGGSMYLPYFSQSFNFTVSGIDYSEHGCELAKRNIALADVKGSVYYGDLFSPPKELLDTFDVALSFGLVEHFSDTADSITHISNMVRPGGLIFTTVPNMGGVTGLAQKFLGREVFDKHVSLSVESLVAAHLKAGLTVLDAGYHEFLNFGVVNIGTARSGGFHTVRSLLHKILLGVSFLVWSLETLFWSFSTNSLTSPYIYCIAKKPEYLLVGG